MPRRALCRSANKQMIIQSALPPARPELRRKHCVGMRRQTNREFAMPGQNKSLEDLFHENLKDIYYAERKILVALPKMAKAVNSDQLRAAFEKHVEETKGQVERLKQVFKMIE